MECTKKQCTVIGVVVGLIVLAGIVWHVMDWSDHRPDGDLFQVVLLANDQVFFGKMHDAYSRMPYMTDVYYLKQEPAKTDANGAILQGVAPSFKVIKRGVDELHMPTDKMYFNAKEILYWENVGSTSLVARGIQADKEQRAKNKAQAAQPTPPATEPK